MDLRLKGKSVLITGSSRGIGLGIAEAFHSVGCRVALNGRDIKELDVATCKLPGAIGVCGDVTVPTDARTIIKQVISDFGELDILICNVGSGSSVSPGSENSDEWKRVFALNLWSTTNMVEAARGALISTKGVVVCISSICGLEVVPGAPVTYSAAKAALNAYVRGIARPLGKDGIRINAVAPGNILFDGSVWHRKLSDSAESVSVMLQNNIALSRFGSVSDVADLVTFLASPICKFATGSIWTLDGGQVHS